MCGSAWRFTPTMMSALVLVAIVGAAEAGSLKDGEAAYERGTMQPRYAFFVRWPIWVTSSLKITSASCTITARACRRITPRP